MSHTRLSPLLAALLLIPGAALAHTGHNAGAPFLAGLGHPVGGADHVLAMLAVGLWAAVSGGRALWAMPLAFVAAMLAGGAMGAMGVPLPGVEPVILASVIVLGSAAALALRPGLVPALAAIALFGVAHGFAHGAEGPGSGLAPYAAGFVLATAALHGAGLGIGLLARAQVARVLGGLAALSGAVLAFG
ncbi:HupE/UreJ family protein [Paracoccaceae bacterium Fryx2]|nr:HupE/UreJ family protein [Paracoccaceae bacterium Fryx2]